MQKTDVVIIGAGAVGCAIARELSKYQVDVTVVEMRDDVGGDASKSNSAIIHTGYDAAPGTLESELVVAANPMYDALCRDLDVPFKRIAAILPAVTEEQFAQLPAIKEKAFKNRVYDVEYLTREQLLEMEPNLNPEVLGGLHIPRESIIDPFILVQAYAENACENGVHFLLNTKVTGIRTEGGRVRAVETTGGVIETRCVINAAALYCDEIAAMVGKADYKVVARRGQFYAVFREGAPIRDLHGNVLDAERDYIAVIQITDARPQYSKAKIIRGRGIRRGDGIELIRKPDQVRLIGE